MLTVISGNNRDGYPCPLNKVGDIFKRGIPPFEAEGLIDLGKASQKEAFPLAGPLSLIFSSTKVTASDSAEVTVSMTSRNSAGYANLSSPKSASAKSRQHRSPMQGVTVTSRNAINGLASVNVGGLRTDNLLNIKTESAFVQTTGKEKGPRPALRVMQLITCEESKELYQNSHLQASRVAQCQQTSQALGSMPLSDSSLRSQASSTQAEKLAEGFFAFSYLTLASIFSISVYGKRIPLKLDLLFFAPVAMLLPRFRCLDTGNDTARVLLPKVFKQKDVDASKSDSVKCLNTNLSMGVKIARPGGVQAPAEPLTKPLMGVTVMAEHQHTQTRPKFTDTYWIIPEYETTPYGKVSFTRQDRRTFIALFKDSRLIWAGRKPVQGIVKITTPQGGVNITTPSTMEEISTVLATISDIETVQGVAHA